MLRTPVPCADGGGTERDRSAKCLNPTADAGQVCLLMWFLRELEALYRTIQAYLGPLIKARVLGALQIDFPMLLPLCETKNTASLHPQSVSGLAQPRNQWLQMFLCCCQVSLRLLSLAEVSFQGQGERVGRICWTRACPMVREYLGSLSF